MLALQNGKMSNESFGNSGKVYKVIVLGDSSVGKTTLTYRFCEGSYLEDVVATIGIDFRSREVNVDGELLTFQLWDTAGQERFRTSIVQQYYRNTHAVIFVYDVTCRKTFDSLTKWIAEANIHCTSDIPKILIGNKSDEIAVVPTNEAQKFADQYNMPFFETSAKLDTDKDNIESIFFTLAYKLKNHAPFALTATPTENIRAVIEDKTTSTCC